MIDALLQLVNSIQLSHAVPAFGGFTLVLGIPSILVMTPAIFIPPRIRRTFSISKVLVYAIFLAVALLPVAWSPIINDILLVSALAHTYLLPSESLPAILYRVLLLTRSPQISVLARYHVLLQAPSVPRRSLHSSHLLTSLCQPARRDADAQGAGDAETAV